MSLEARGNLLTRYCFISLMQTQILPCKYDPQWKIHLLKGATVFFHSNTIYLKSNLC